MQWQSRISASIAVSFGQDWRRLEYSRRLRLHAANIMSGAAFQVIIEMAGEHVVDEQEQTGMGDHDETSWTRRTVDLTAYAGRDIGLRFVLTATDTISVTSAAEAWIDQIEIFGP